MNVSFFQHDEALQWFYGALDVKAIKVYSTDHNGWLVGQLAQGKGIKKYLSTRVVVQYGPVGNILPASFNEVLLTLHKNIPWYTLFIQFRMEKEYDLLKDSFHDFGYVWSDRLNLLTSVKDINLAWRSMSSNRHRQIRKSLKAGISFSLKPSKDDISAFYSILSSLYKEKVSKPIPSESFFQRINILFQSGKLNGFLGLCMYKGEVVGGIVCPETKGETVHELYICGKDSELKAENVYPSVMATWFAMEEANRRGCHTFDFMGMGVPEKPYGVREFKARFGGKWINAGRWNKTYNKPLYFVAELMYNLVLVKKHLIRSAGL